MGLNLKFIVSLTVNGDCVVKLNSDEVFLKEIIWNSVLIGYVMGDIFSFKDMLKFVQGVWIFVYIFRVYLYDEGYFIFRFVFEDDRNLVLYSGYFIYNNKFMIFRFWEVSFKFDNSIIRIIFFWVKFSGLFLYLWFTDSLSRIVSVISIFLYFDKLTVQMEILCSYCC